MGSHLEEEVFTAIGADTRKLSALRMVRQLDLPEGAIAGDLVRCAVFDRLHRHPEATQLRVIDVVYFDAERTDPSIDQHLELELVAQAPRRPWRVRNLARLVPEAENLADALGGAFDATANAVAARVDRRDELELVAPFGLGDLVGGVVKPTHPDRAPHLRRQVDEEKWMKRYPDLQRLDAAPPASSPREQ